MVIPNCFSRIFFRIAINNGLPVIELEDGVDEMEKGDPVAIDFENSAITHERNAYHFPAIPVNPGSGPRAGARESSVIVVLHTSCCYTTKRHYK